MKGCFKWAINVENIAKRYKITLYPHDLTVKAF